MGPSHHGIRLMAGTTDTSQTVAGSVMGKFDSYSPEIDSHDRIGDAYTPTIDSDLGIGDSR